jgi:P-aminobenzoate N-oxygenase AurF
MPWYDRVSRDSAMPHTRFEFRHALLDQLSSNSLPYRDPLETLDWGSLKAEDWWLPEEAVSLHGLREYEVLPLAQRQRLSRIELISFLRTGIWLESLFMERLARRVMSYPSPSMQAYALHEIREEAGHSLMFLKLMEACGCYLSGKPQIRKLVEWLGRLAPDTSLLYSLALVVGEEVSDRMNRHIRMRGKSVHPFIHQMCSLHIVDEARHLSLAHAALEDAIGRAHPLSRRIYGRLATSLLRQSARLFYLPASEVYALAGFQPAASWRAKAARNPARAAFVKQCLGPAVHRLENHGFRIGRIWN